MQGDIAELRRQLEEERRAREGAERRQEEERQAREKAEERLRTNSQFRLLHRCHESLSQSIRVETNAALTTQGTDN